MFGLFKPKEISLFYKALDLLEHRVGASSSFDHIRSLIDTDIKRSATTYVEAMRASKRPEHVVGTTVANAAGDIVESGRLCLYRGLLSPAGEEMFKLYRDTLDYLVETGLFDSAKRDEEIAAIRQNIRMVG